MNDGNRITIGTIGISTTKRDKDTMEKNLVFRRDTGTLFLELGPMDTMNVKIIILKILFVIILHLSQVLIK